MASYQQLNYCRKCKKNVSLNDRGQCSICGSTQIKKSWTVRFRLIEARGEVQKRLTGFQTKKEAEQSYIDFVTHYKPVVSEKKNILRFEDVLEGYFNSYQLENEESTIYEKKRVFNNFICPFFKNKEVDKITKAELQNWQNYIWQLKNPKTRQSYSWKYLSKIRGFFYNFLEYCKTIYDIPNLYQNIKTPKNKEIKEPIRFWEISTFNKFIDTVEDVQWKTLWCTFMFTGARFNEIRALSVNDICNNEITINKALPGKKAKDRAKPKSTKNHKQVKKQIPDVLINQLQQYFSWRKENKVTGEFLFGGQKPLSENAIRRKLTKQTKEAQVEYINPHGFRHSYVSLLINLGIPTKIIAELIGDTEMQVIKTYGHLYADAKNKAITLLNKELNAECA